MDLGGGSWAILNIVGPLLLVIVIAWAALRNRRTSTRTKERSEQATHDLYKAEEAARRDKDGDAS